MRRREGDGCPVAGALQLVGDKWTMLVVRDLFQGARRTTELLAALHPISSRTLVGRLRDMERDTLIERRDYGGSPPRVEYVLTERGRLLLLCLRPSEELANSSTATNAKTANSARAPTAKPARTTATNKRTPHLLRAASEMIRLSCCNHRQSI